MKSYIRLLMNAVFVFIVAELTSHYYDIGLITSNAVIRVGILCAVHMIYIAVAEVLKIRKGEA